MLIHISRVQSSGSPRGLCLYTSTEFLSQALPSLYYIQTWQLGELFMVPTPKQLAVSATGATPAHKDPPTRPPYRTVYGQSAQKALTTAMMADDPDE